MNTSPFTGALLLWIVPELIVILLLAACSPLAILNALTPPSTRSVTEGAAYGPLPRQRLDIHVPRAPASVGGYPMVVFFYGGSWNRGERADYRFVGEALAARGILTLIPDYRLYPEVRYPSFLEDSALALAYALKQAAALGGNPQRVFVMGHSAGAYNAAMLALDGRWLSGAGHSPAELAGFIGLAGPYDFLPITNPDARPVFFHPDYPAGTQPIDHVTVNAPTSFLGAAQRDLLVNPQRNTRELAKRLQTVGVPVSVKLYGKVNHLTLIGTLAWSLRWLAPVLDDVAAFVDHSQEKPPSSAA